MIEQGRPYVQIAQQLQAVETAIENAKKALIYNHTCEYIERPPKPSGPQDRTPPKELRLITKYL